MLVGLVASLSLSDMGTLLADLLEPYWSIIYPQRVGLINYAELFLFKTIQYSSIYAILNSCHAVRIINDLCGAKCVG